MNFREHLKTYDTNILINFLNNYGLKRYITDNYNKLINTINDSYLMKSNFINILKSISIFSLEIIKSISNNIIVSINKDNIEAYIELYTSLIANNNNLEITIPLELINLFKEIDNVDLEKEIKAKTYYNACIDYANLLWGKYSYKELNNLFKLDNDIYNSKIGQNILKELNKTYKFDLTNEDFEIKYLSINDDLKNLQYDKRHLPTINEIYELKQYGYISNDKIKEIINKSFNNINDINLIKTIQQDACKLDCSLNDLLNKFKDYDKEIIKDIFNNTRRLINNGFTNIELSMRDK